MGRRIAIGIVAVLVIGALVVVRRHEVARFALEIVARIATGYQVQIDDQRLGLSHGAFLGVRVSSGGDPVLAAQRVDLYYSLRDLLPGSTHRFGLLAVTIDRPDLTIVHRADGSYNVSAPTGGGTSSIPGRPNAVPLRFNVRIRNGSAALVDQGQFYKEARLQRVDNIAVNLDADSSGRTHYTVSGNFANLSEAPFAAIGTIDVTRGFAMHHVRAAAVPILTIGNYIINSSAARILAGTARNFDARIYALDVQPDLPINYHLSAKLDVTDGRLVIASLMKPLRAIHGRLQIVDNALFATRLTGTIAGVPVVAAGGIFDFSNPQWQFGMYGAGDLTTLRSVMAFSKNQPVHGFARVGLLLEGPLADPVLVMRGSAARAAYAKFPLTDVSTSLALQGGVLGLFPAHMTYAGVDTTLRGTLTLGSTVQNDLLIHANASSDRLPYASEVLRNEPMTIDAILRGPPGKLGAYGTVASARGIDRAAALFSFDPDGVAQVAPVVIDAGYGELAGRYRLDRTTNSSAFWMTAQGVSLRAPSKPVFPGATLPSLPPIDGMLSDGAVAGGGSGNDVILAGHAVGERATIAGVRFDRVTANFAGNLQNASISSAHASGPWGQFDGYGSFGTGALVARGNYRGTLEGLRQFTGDTIAGHGDLSGPVAFELSRNRVVIQAQDLTMRGATVHGLPVLRATGTMAYSNGLLHVYSANVDVAGGRVIAAGTYSTGSPSSGQTIALVGSGLQAGTLRNIGIPLDAGEVAVSGNVGAGASLPAFNGGVVVQNGRAQSFPVAGSALVTMRGDSLHLEHAVGALGTTYGFVSGDVTALTSGAPAYALSATVPAGDVANALSTLQLPGYATNGTFNAQFNIGGSGVDPRVSGPVNVPAGSVNGLPFVDARGLLAADRGSLRADAGSVLVGTTRTGFAVQAGGGAMSFNVSAPQATFSDFNNFFDTGDTLAGHGAVAFSAAASGGHVTSSGALSVFGFRYRSLPIGDTAAHWSTTRNALNGRLEVGGSQGVLHVGGTIALAPATAWQNVVSQSRYNLQATLTNLDLNTWLPAIGYPELPMLGRVSGNAHIAGRYPHLAVSGSGHLQGGTVGRLPIDRLDVALANQGERVQIRSAELAAPGLLATAEGSFGLAPTAPLNVSVHAQSSDVPKLVAQAAKVKVDVSGTVEATAQFGGSLAKPTFAAAFDAENLTAYGVVFKSIFGSARLNGRKIELRNAGATFLHGSATLAGYLPLQMQPLHIGPRQEPVSVDLQLQDVDPGAFDAVFGHHTKLSGSIVGHVGIHGTVGAPRVFGQLALSNGSYVSDFDLVPVTAANVAVSFDHSTASLQRLSANLGSGSVKASGRITFLHGFGQYGDVSYSIAANAHGAQLDVPQFGRGTVESDLRFERSPPGIAHLVGDATATNAVIPFAAFLAAQSGSGSTATPGAKPAFDLAFDLGVTAGKNVRVRGGNVAAGLDIGAAGAAHLGGTLSAPTLDGRFDATDGTLTYFDRAFRLREGYVTFNASDGVMPTLHAVGVTHVVNPDPSSDRNPYGSADVTVTIDGQLGSLHVALDSNPPGYTSDQVLGLIAPFGGFVQGIQFDQNGQPNVPGTFGQVDNAAVAVPGVLVGRQTQTGMLSFSQEAFNILNAQFMTGLLSPLESTLGKGLGLEDVSLTLNYYGSVGLNVRHGIGRFLSAVYATTFGIPQRESFGLEYAPNDSTSAQLSFFFQNGPTQLFNPAGTNISTNLAVTAAEPLQGQSGFSFAYRHLFK